MLTIKLVFEGRAPVTFRGTLFECGLQLANARLFKGFQSFDICN